MDLGHLIETSTRLIASTTTSFQRSLFDEINWKHKLIEIKGSRGVGKTTLMLQKAKELKEKSESQVLYTSLDLPFFYQNSIYEVADSFFKLGGEILFLDEVHKYPSKNPKSDWSLEIKNIHDSFPKLKLIYSGSSVLQLYKGHGDLSRRKASYHLKGLSFREYLQWQGILDWPRFSLDELLANHPSIATSISQNIKPLKHFKEYLKNGYFPFFAGDEIQYQQQLRNTINLVLEVDIPHLAAIQFDSIERLKKLLSAISTTVPYTPKLTEMAQKLHITDSRTLLKYIHLLDIAEIISTLSSVAKGNKILQKPDKIYLNNTNLFYALNYTAVEIGTLRETFFYNQLKGLYPVHYPQNGDFLVDGKFVFEIGGKSKTKKQLKDETHGFVVQDDIETGYGNRVPLWLFGFLY